MPFNGSGTYSLPSGNPVVTNTPISSTVHNATTSDIASALTNCVTRDGQSPPTASLPMGNQKITGLAKGTAAGDAVRYEQAAKIDESTGANSDIKSLSGLTTPLSVAQGGTGSSTAPTTTGTGSVVLNNSPTLITPVLGTPSSGNLSNCTFPTLNQNTTGSAASATTATSADGLKTASGIVSVSSATAPTTGQVLVATSGTAATWQSLPTGTGTVTSVAMTVPSFLSVTGSPVTSTGTLAVSLSGTALPVANGGTGATTLTGVLKGNGTSAFTAATAGTDYVAPGGALGTPSSGTLTSCTGLPISTGVSGLAANVATFLQTPSSANLAAALTDETGTAGKVVFDTNPTFPAQINLTANSGYNIYASGTADNYLAGRLGIGVAPATAVGVYVAQTTTDSSAYGFLNSQTASAATTATLRGFQTSINTAASAFTLGSLSHYYAVQGSFGAGSSVSYQIGFDVNGNLTDAVNNYGFYGGIAAGANRYNLYMAGTADNYLAGSLGIGSLTNAQTALNISGTYPSTGGVTQAVNNAGTFPSTTTSVGRCFTANPTTQVASFTLGTLQLFYASQQTFGAGSTVTNQYGFYAESTLTGATNNYGFYGGIASGANRYNLYMAGSADNYLAGNVSIGVSASYGKLLVYGDAVNFSPSADNGSNGIGACVYGTNVATATSSVARLYLTGGNAAHAGSLDLRSGSVIGSTINMYNVAGTKSVYFNTDSDSYINGGNVGIGTTSPDASTRLTIGGTPSVSSPNGQLVNATFSSAATGTAISYSSLPSTAAASFTLGTMIGFKAAQGTIGAASAVTSQYGYLAESNLTGATNNIGFFGNIAAAAGRYNFYAGGTAVNAFSGDVNIFGAGKLGYTTGSGGAVTQTGTRTSSVTLNKTNGAITLVSAAGSATYQAFYVFNSTISTNDVVVCSFQQASINNKYAVFTTVDSTGFTVIVSAVSGTTTETPVINFAVIKAVNA